MHFISRLTDYFSSESQVKYTGLAKKDDNFAIDEAKNWVSAYPIDYIQQNIRYSNIETIAAYGKKVIQDLKRIPLTSSNIEIIKTHLVEMCKKNSFLKQVLIEKIRDLHIQKGLGTPLTDKLSSIFEIREYKQT